MTLADALAAVVSRPVLWVLRLCGFRFPGTYVRFNEAEIEYKERVRNSPAPLDSKRKRRLSLSGPSISDISKTQRTAHQAHSSLFRLPLEIRTLIYRNVLGCGVVHILRMHKRLAHARCVGNLQDTDMREHPCWGNSALYPGYRYSSGYFSSPVGGIPARDGGLLALLKTCRRVYSEAIDILYSANLFDFNHLDGVLSLFSTVRPQRLQHVRSMQLTWNYYSSLLHSRYPPNDAITWSRFWVTVSGLKSLEYLHVIIEGRVDPHSDESERQIFMPLKRVRGIKDFRVCCQWSIRQDLTTFLEDAPFKLHSRFGRCTCMCDV